ncbi:unnamed protein product [Lactuca virosa]|uniref:Uncharacterized protein n=1 Tax=Lactuca virosa TaxID=75947 RepID=A0AAU9MAX3_9ASTR|nr:unnamed protein product [Lactuca virosa]
MEAIMQKLQNQLETMKESLALVHNTFTSINQSRQKMIQEAPDEMPYRHVVITESLMNDLDKDTVLMLDIFQSMQDNMSAATDICNKIIEDHRTP